MSAISIDIPPHIGARLHAAVTRVGESESAFLTQALLQRLDELDEVFVAEERIANIRAGRADTVPIEAIMQRYGMAH